MQIHCTDNSYKKLRPGSKAHENWEKFWDASTACVQNLQRQTGLRSLVIDVGAGSLQSARALNFFKDQHTVHIHDTPENTFRKVRSRSGNAWEGRSLADFKAVEYSPARQAIYTVCRHRIDLNVRSKEQAITELLCILSAQAEAMYRLRMGDYRILFDVEDRVIVIRRIGNRKDVYD